MISESVEGVGEAVTGGMAARAVEPGAGEAGPGHGGACLNCLNCGTALIGDYCHVCGQAGHVHRTLAAFWHDVAHSVLHFEGKIWRTLPLLAWRPGELTRRYVEGERARFVSPMALFLFSVFLMFAAFSALGGPLRIEQDPRARAEAARDLRQERAALEAKLEALEAERERVRAAGGSTAAVEARLTAARRELKVIDVAGRVVGGGRAGAGESRIDLETGWGPLDRAVAKANENPSLLLYKIQSNAYKFSWTLIPLSVPFLWLLLFWKRRYKLYDHMVFVTYSIAFMSLALVALTLLRPLGLGEGLIGVAATLIPPIHMYRQLRGAYALSRASALWRTLFLLLFAMMAGGLFFTLLVAMGALG